MEALLFLLDLVVVTYLIWRVHKTERAYQSQTKELGMLAPKEGEKA